jgi:hypothetical protein
MRAVRCGPVALLPLFLYLGGCYTWRPAAVSPRRLIEEERPSQVRISGPDIPLVVLRTPRLEGDSAVLGSSDAGVCSGNLRLSCAQLGRDAGADTVRVPLASIDGLEVQRFNLTRTIVAAVAVPGTVLVLALAFWEPDLRLRR